MLSTQHSARPTTRFQFRNPMVTYLFVFQDTFITVSVGRYPALPQLLALPFHDPEIQHLIFD